MHPLDYEPPDRDEKQPFFPRDPQWWIKFGLEVVVALVLFWLWKRWQYGL